MLAKMYGDEYVHNLWLLMGVERCHFAFDDKMLNFSILFLDDKHHVIFMFYIFRDKLFYVSTFFLFA